MKSRHPIPGERIINLDERGSSADTRSSGDCPLSRLAPNEESRTTSCAKPTENCCSRLDSYMEKTDARIRGLEERLSKIDGKERGIDRPSIKLLAGSEQCSSRTTARADSEGASVSRHQTASLASMEPGRGSAVSSVSPRISGGNSSSSRAFYEPPPPNYQLTGQFYLSYERVMGVDETDYAGNMPNDLQHAVTLAIPTCLLPQQWYCLCRLSNLSSPVVLYGVLYNNRQPAIPLNSPMVSFNSSSDGGRYYRRSTPFYPDMESRRCNLMSNAYYQDSMGDVVAPRISPFL